MQKIYAHKWKQKFEGGFLKGAFWRAIHDANLAVTLICTWRVDTTPAIWFFTMETNTFWSCFQFLYDFWRILIQKLRIIFQIVWGLTISFRGFITRELTRIFVNFRVIHVLLSLILFYWIMLIRFLTHRLNGILQMAVLPETVTPIVYMYAASTV